MTTQSTLTVQNGDTLAAVRGLLKDILAQGIVDKMLVPLEVPSADQVTPILVEETSQIDTANPLAPVMRINSAAVLARMQQEHPGKRIGAVLRPCELRAAVELAKVGRVDARRATLIGIDCMGTYEPDAYAQIARASVRDESPTDEMMRWTRQGPIAPYRLRTACQICERFVPESADITIGLIGMNVRERLSVESTDEVAGLLKLPRGEGNGRARAISRLQAIRHNRRDDALQTVARLLADLPALVGLVAGCTACGECLSSCPYCGTGAFTPKPAKEPHTDRIRGWSSGNQQVDRGNSPFGQMVEFGRRAASCSGCGMCESSCARHVPLTAIQAMLGSKVQEEFSYLPGRSLEEKYPWAKV